MIDITTGKPQCTKTRTTMHKNFDIDVTIDSVTHNLEIDVFHTEDVDEGNPEFGWIKVGNNTFEGGEHCDVGEKLTGHLESWFDDNFGVFSIGKTKEDFEAIFSAVWEYIEEKVLY